MKKRLIPFDLWPANWGLEGKRKQKAMAEYYYEGEELERKLAEIDFQGNELEQQLLDLDLKYGKLDQYEHDKKMVPLKYTDQEEIKHRLLRVEYEHRKLTETQYDRLIADLLHEPFIGVLSSHYDTQTGRLAIEYDWNDEFIKVLASNGYRGSTDFEVVDSWMHAQYAPKDLESIQETEEMKLTRTRKRRKPDSDTVEYS